MNLKLLLDAKARLGEGALWDEREGVLYWLDILASKVHRYHPKTGENETFDIGQVVGTVVLRESDGLMLAVQHGFATFDLDKGKLTMLQEIEVDLPNNRFNDGKADPAGRFWAGTMALDFTPKQGSLYRLDTDGTVKKMLSEISVSNGIVWTSDHKTMYYTDSPTRTVTAFDYDIKTGNIDNARIAVKVPKSMGFPDGMAIDEDGNLWVAHYRYGAVACWSPDTGNLLEEIKLPCSLVTSCAFGGDHLDKLYITSSWEGLSNELHAKEVLAGGLFLLETKVRGLPTYRYKG